MGWFPRSIRAILDAMAYVAVFFAPLFLRVALALPFFKSGLTRWNGLSISPATYYLFTDQFKLHIFGQIYDIPYAEIVAQLTACAEILLPILIVLGLATRFAAFGLLAMTCVIQLVYPDAWETFHLPWAAMALSLIAIGPGPLSLDRRIEQHYGAKDMPMSEIDEDIAL